MINRRVVIIRPVQPDIDWAKNLGDSDIVPNSSNEAAVYLIPSYEDDFQVWERLANVYNLIFENELFCWHVRTADWPKNRSLTMFKEWFKIEFHLIVEDLCGHEIINEDGCIPFVPMMIFKLCNCQLQIAR